MSKASEPGGRAILGYLLQLVAWTGFMAALILWPAGTLAYPGAWAFIAFLAIGGVAMILWLSKHSPSLLRERMAPPLQRDQKPWDRVWLSLFVPGFCAWVAFTDSILRSRIIIAISFCTTL